MQKQVYITETNCITPIGFDVRTNIENIVNGVSGISHQNSKLMKAPFYAGVIDDEKLNTAFT
ncbi:MAG TPA: hypothetical protein VK476_03095, partial [Flavobacterium sp.]|nr:hypothetical protein [Flavobacterium sp.]